MKIIKIDLVKKEDKMQNFSRHSGASGINGLCSFMGLLNV